MKPYDLNVLADGILREQAVTAIELLSRNGLPKPKHFGRTQMKDLQHIARNEPLKVLDYAKHQQGKLPKDKFLNVRPSHQDIAAIWQVVIDCYHSNSVNTWSLEGEGRNYWEQSWRALDTPLPKGASTEDRQQRNLQKAQRKQFQDRWLSDIVPIFFDFFCTEYVFHLPH